MWKLHRYYLFETAINTALTFTVIFGLATMSLLYKALAMVKGGGVFDALTTTVLLAVDILPHLLNSSLMFATVLTFARASQDREITAACAAGISPRVLLTSVLLLGVASSGFAGWALHSAIPRAHHERFRIIASLYQGEIEMMLRGQDHFEFEGGGTMTWQSRDRSDGREIYHEVSIFTRSKRAASIFGITGQKEGSFLTAERVWFDSRDTGGLTMHCEGLSMPTTGDYLARLAVGLDTRSLSGRGNDPVDVRHLTSETLLSEVYRGVSSDPILARYTVHRRTCLALLPFLLAPIGFCIGIGSRDRGRVASMSLCMIPLGLVYLVDFLGESAVRRIESGVLGWLPAAVVLGAGIPFCWRTLRR